MIQGRVHNLGNSWQQPTDAEPGGATWHKIEDPGTGWHSSKTSGWTADSFTTSSTGTACLNVDFSNDVPAGTKAVRVFVESLTNANYAYYRPNGDTNISTSPNGSSEYSHRILGDDALDVNTVMYLSTDYKVQIAVVNTAQDIYVSYPSEYLL
jgi:hypothetical protein